VSIPRNLTIADAARQLRDGSLTSLDLTTTILDRAIRANESLGAYVEITADTALEQAAAADAAFKAGTDLGPLQGVPLAIKDIIAMRGTHTTANSRVLSSDWSGNADAAVVRRLREAGAVVVGKSTTYEFAIGLPDGETGFLIPHNPWDPSRTAGGSSSGTGIAVAAGLALGGLGTDTAGSIRAPASANGHTGLKVTYGRVPTSGVVPLAPSLDTVGPMARSARDCALLLDVMAGHDPADPNASRHPVDTYSTALDGDIDGLKIGVPMPYFFDHDYMDPEVRTAVLTCIGQLEDLGAVVSRTELRCPGLASDANMILLVAEAFAYHRNDLVHRWTDYGRPTRLHLCHGAIYNAADLVQAVRFRHRFSTAAAALLTDYDVLITPTTPHAAPVASDVDASERLRAPSYMAQWSLAGLPAIAIPAGFDTSGLPLSLQIIGRPFAEATVLKVADALQSVTDYHLATPPLFA